MHGLLLLWAVVCFLHITPNFTVSMDMNCKRVAVIGGGPAALVACKKLIEVGFPPKLFHDGIGGLWNSKKKPFWSTMRTNLSKFTCCFSDSPWPEESHPFLQQKDVHRYLLEYAESFLTSNEMSTTKRVTHLAKNEDGIFTLRWMDEGNHEAVELFDHVVVASGFFSKPLQHSFVNIPSFKGRIFHSSQYVEPSDFEGRNVVIAGSSFSSAEIAADVATTAKSVTNVVPHASWVIPRFLPTCCNRPDPVFVPVDLLFYQLDVDRDLSGERREAVFRLDNDRRRSHAYMQSLLGPNGDEDVMKEVRQGDQEQLNRGQCSDTIIDGDGDGVSESDGEGVVPSVFVSISDAYTSAVRAGHVRVLRGYVHSGHDNTLVVSPTRPSPLSPSPSEPPVQAPSLSPSSSQGHAGTLTQTQGEPRPSLISPSGEASLTDVDDLILCTGWGPDLGFMDEALLGAMEYERAESLLPLLLYKEVLHPAVPGLFFVGMYRGPYFAVMELQAQAVASYISGTLPLPSDEEAREGVELARRIRAQAPRPQFPHGDYVGMSIDWMRQLDIPLPSAPTPTPPSSPPPLQASSTNPSLSTSSSPPPPGEPSSECLEEPLIFMPSLLLPLGSPARASQAAALRAALASYEGGKYLSRSVHNGLQGTWHFDRVLTSRLQAMPSGVVSGSISWTRFDRKSSRLDYEEKGTFVTNTGLKMEVSGSQYTFSHNEEDDCIDVFFGNKVDEEQAGRKFVSLRVAGRDEEQGWTFRGERHLCGQDTYDVTYVMAFRGLALTRIVINIEVTGPFKDYTSHTTLTRT